MRLLTCFCYSERGARQDGLGGQGATVRLAGKSILLVSRKVKNAKLDCEGEKTAVQSYSLAGQTSKVRVRSGLSNRSVMEGAFDGFFAPGDELLVHGQDNIDELGLRLPYMLCHENPLSMADSRDEPNDSERMPGSRSGKRKKSQNCAKRLMANQLGFCPPDS